MKQPIPEPPQTYSYELPGGWIVLAGKTESDNDRLSIKFAHPQDWWFHVNGMPGSHVLLKAKESGEEPGIEVLKAAAAIAAYHSKARSGGIVPVSCTRARFVTKPRGAKPGTVSIRKEKTIKVRPALPKTEVGLGNGSDLDGLLPKQKIPLSEP
jgi:predicted ribosome quality control (RQC) complex YloA/Tae2 family protein